MKVFGPWVVGRLAVLAAIVQAAADPGAGDGAVAVPEPDRAGS